MNQSEVGVGLNCTVDGKAGTVIEHYYAFKEVWPAGQDRFVVKLTDGSKLSVLAADIRAPNSPLVQPPAKPQATTAAQASAQLEATKRNNAVRPHLEK